ncbi:acyl-CoA dehydrogenase family protein [Mycobacterium sp. NPDC003449]
MLAKSGPDLDAALTELGWADMLSETPDQAIALVFRLLGETGSHASVLNDVVLQSSRRPPDGLPVLPYAGGIQVVWERPAADEIDQWVLDNSTPLDVLGGLPLRRVNEGDLLRLAEARVAVAWWLIGSARAMLALARRHALDRVQFGKPIASFQAVRHRLAETLVAIEGAEATLTLPGADNPDLTALLAKAAAGKAALAAARNCQQVLAGIGFTAEHDLHRHIERVVVLDAILGSSRELTRRAGAGLRARGSAPRLAQL